MRYHEQGSRRKPERRTSTPDKQQAVPTPEKLLRRELSFIHAVIKEFKKLESGVSPVVLTELPRNLVQAMVRELPSLNETTSNNSIFLLEDDQLDDLWKLSQAGRAEIDEVVTNTFADDYTLRCGIEITTAQQFFGAISVMAQYDTDKINFNAYQVFPNNRTYSYTAVRMEFGQKIDFPCRLVFTRNLSPWALKRLEEEEARVAWFSREMTEEHDVSKLTQTLFDYLIAEQITEEQIEALIDDHEAYQAASVKWSNQYMFGITLPVDEQPELAALLQRVIPKPGATLRYHDWVISNSGIRLKLQHGLDNKFTHENVKQLVNYLVSH